MAAELGKLVDTMSHARLQICAMFADPADVNTATTRMGHRSSVPTRLRRGR